MNDSVYIFLVLADISTGFLIWLYLKDYFNQFGGWKSAVIKSLVYPLFFGGTIYRLISLRLTVKCEILQKTKNGTLSLLTEGL